MHCLKHHADELDAVQVKWKKGYYTAEDRHIVPGTPFYPSEHPFSAIDDPAFPARRLELEEERHPRAEAPATCSPMVRMNSAGGIYRQEARRWASEAPPRKRSRPPSPPRSRRNSRGGGRTAKDHTAVITAENPKQQGATLETTNPAENSQPMCYEANATRARQAEAEHDEFFLNFKLHTYATGFLFSIGIHSKNIGIYDTSVYKNTDIAFLYCQRFTSRNTNL